MKNLIFTCITISIYLVSCSGNNKYYEPKEIVENRTDKTDTSNIWISLKNNESIDGYTKIGNSIFGGEIACNVEPLKGIDIESFKVLSGTYYAKDKNNVYYPLVQPCIDYEDCGVCYYSEVIINNANPKSFEYLEKGYATDGKYVYFHGELIDGADGKTFKVISGPDNFFFTIDKNNVYKEKQVFKNADPETFYYDETDKRNVITNDIIIGTYQHTFIIGDRYKKWEFIYPNTIKEIN